ncbi:hypothetical protein [Parapedobacter composti]|nr:hypothetical protein [Parapedobacter composti]
MKTMLISAIAGMVMSTAFAQENGTGVTGKANTATQAGVGKGTTAVTHGMQGEAKAGIALAAPKVAAEANGNSVIQVGGDIQELAVMSGDVIGDVAIANELEVLQHAETIRLQATAVPRADVGSAVAVPDVAAKVKATVNAVTGINVKPVPVSAKVNIRNGLRVKL